MELKNSHVSHLQDEVHLQFMMIKNALLCVNYRLSVCPIFLWTTEMTKLRDEEKKVKWFSLLCKKKNENKHKLKVYSIFSYYTPAHTSIILYVTFPLWLM
jgi:hypothetical protein